MLETIGVSSIEELFDEVPSALRAPTLQGVSEGWTEMEVTRLLNERASQDDPKLSFIGAGAYEHHIPAAVWQITTRGEFYSAYTPYQAEASQGLLQLVYEYQSMMTALTGMELSNASLYDGASSLAEGVLMAVRANRKARSKRILVPRTVHPNYRRTVHTIGHAQGIELIELPYNIEGGHIRSDALEPYEGKELAAVVIPQPNFFGVLEEVDQLTDWAHANGAMVIAVVNPTSLALLSPPGEWGKEGADIVCGEGQPLGVPLSSGGPYFGFMCCRQPLLHKMPGRLVGRTRDQEGKEGFTLTLQAREQHIRRSKATSNICTNQGLLVTAATIYMALLGPGGLERVAAHCHSNTRSLFEGLTALKGVEPVFDRPYFHEAAVRLSKPIEPVLGSLLERGIVGGFNLKEEYPELGEALLVCATETKTVADLEHYIQALHSELSG